MSEHINGYSLALFSLAKEEKKLKQYKAQSVLVIDALTEVEEYERLLHSNSIETEVKHKMITQAFGKKLNKNLLNFLLLLVDRNKFNVACPALKKLVKFINEEANIHEGTVYTAIKLTPAELKKIEKKTEKLLKMDITLINKTDAEMISGFKVVVGDEVIEDTIASRLEDIKNQLLGKEN